MCKVLSSSSKDQMTFKACKGKCKVCTSSSADQMKCKGHNVSVRYGHHNLQIR